MKIGKAGLDLIKSFEGFRANAYPDPGSKNGLPITIGYGTTRIDGKPVQLGMTCAESQALTWLMHDIADTEKLVSDNVKTQLSQNQFDALVSIVYNVGPGSNIKDGIIRLKSGVPSPLLNKVNKRDFVGAGQEFLKWCRAGGIIMSGLERRREAERQLFLTSDNNGNH